MNREFADGIEKVQPFEIERDANRLIGASPRSALRADPQPIRGPRNIGLGKVLDHESVPSSPCR